MSVFKDTADFCRTVLGMPSPLKPTRLHPDRKKWTITALDEELAEFTEAETLADEVDALEDLIYFSAGRLYEMGIDGDAIHNEVHRANMAKHRGELSKRPNSRGYDAIKPIGWKGPQIERVIAEHKTPKIIVMGMGEHGKDTVSEMLADIGGLSFRSSSMFCAEKVIMPLLKDLEIYRNFMLSFDADSDIRTRMEAHLSEMREWDYQSAEEAFNDRHNHRELWFQAISKFCDPATRLGQELFQDYDIYCGIRSQREFSAIKNAGLVDATIWVDAGSRIPPEDQSSISVSPFMADYFIDNSGSLDELRTNVQNVMGDIQDAFKSK